MSRVKRGKQSPRHPDTLRQQRRERQKFNNLGQGRQRRRFRPFRRQRDQNSEGDQSGAQNFDRENYKLTVKKNASFEAFYSGIGLVPEGEWEQFLETLRKPLPVTFRITGFRSQSQELLKIVKGKYLNELMNADVLKTSDEEKKSKQGTDAQGQTADGQAAEQKMDEETSTDEKKASDEDTPSEPVKPTCLQWYPNELAWQINLSRKDVRRNAQLEKLKTFLFSETESGNISRQEAVSMIPPMLLDVKPHHKVLDMCAAPGSKTAQIIEYLHATDDNKEPEGYVIANDVDNKRCYLMIHQIKRLQSPCCAVINHDAATLPNFKSEDNSNENVQYDRVLCDVPCSGDGTLRKNFDIWDKWNCKSGGNLHWQQIRILKRGLELLAVGGRLVYSTCSFNPIEDEAVINAALKQCEGSVELVEVGDSLPGLKYIPGLLTWKILSTEKEWYDTYEQAKTDNAKHIAPSMFPPSPDIAKERHLDRCMHILPHHQDTGGFFIAVLQKTQQLPWLKPREPVIQTPVKEKTESSEPSEGVTNATGEKRKLESNGTDKEDGERPEKRAKEQKKIEKKTHGYKEDPFLFLSSTDPIWPPIQKFYGIPEDFDNKQILYRTDRGKIRTLYYVSKAIRDLVIRNSDRVKIVNTGVKVFGRSPSPLVPDCEFRINQEGLGAIVHLMTSRMVKFSKKDMVVLLTQENPFLDRLSSPGREVVKDITPGSMIFKYSPSEGEEEEGPSCDVIVCGWRGKTSIRSFVAKPDRTHILRLFGLELSEILKQQEEEKEARKQAEAIISMETNEGEVSDSELLKEDETGEEKKESVEEKVEEEKAGPDDETEKQD